MILSYNMKWAQGQEEKLKISFWPVNFYGLARENETAADKTVRGRVMEEDIREHKTAILRDIVGVRA